MGTVLAVYKCKINISTGFGINNSNLLFLLNLQWAVGSERCNFMIIVGSVLKVTPLLCIMRFPCESPTACLGAFAKMFLSRKCHKWKKLISVQLHNSSRPGELMILCYSVMLRRFVLRLN